MYPFSTNVCQKCWTDSLWATSVVRMKWSLEMWSNSNKSRKLCETSSAYCWGATPLWAADCSTFFCDDRMIIIFVEKNNNDNGETSSHTTTKVLSAFWYCGT